MARITGYPESFRPRADTVSAAWLLAGLRYLLIPERLVDEANALVDLLVRG
jgi:hypothetical protein